MSEEEEKQNQTKQPSKADSPNAAEKKAGNRIIQFTIIGIVVVAVILIVGSISMGRSASKSTEEAVHNVSLFYLDELAGRREQVVANNLESNLRNMEIGIALMQEKNLDSMEHLQAYQARMKQLYGLDKFAFVDQDGLIYTSKGTRDDIDSYPFDYKTLDQPVVAVKDLKGDHKSVIIAMPLEEPIPFEGKELTECFMEIDMDVMLQGVSMASSDKDVTFCNIYSGDGVPLTNQVLGGMADEDNLIDALDHAQFEPGYSCGKMAEDFAAGREGVTTFTYNDALMTLYYVPVEDTGLLLTYLVQESLIGDQIRPVTEGIIKRSVLQTLLTALVLLAMFMFMMVQIRKSSRAIIEKEKLEAESRIKEEELEERKELNQALSDALAAAEEASKAKTTFLSNMSHEIRTPMNAIIGLDNIALSDPDISDATRDHLEKIDSSAKHLLNLINDILDMSRIESGRMILKKEEFSFSRMLEQINTMVSGQCSDKNVEYHCRINGDIDDRYIGDDMKLRQVIINILGNAVKFTPEGGEISFTVERTARYEGNSTLLLTISDTGIGMDEEFLPKLFDAFSQEDASSTSRYGSSGLGLAITKNIVEMMNGDIQVESRKGEGTTFRVTVTLQDADRNYPVAEDGSIDPHEMSVLVIDDDPVACSHAKLVLEKIGINAETVLSGEEALEMVRLHHARRDPYNLILVDWKMPGMDGVETTKKIRAVTGDESAIIILTAYRWDDILEEAMSVGVDSFLSKPLFASNIVEEFQRTMVKKTSAGKKEHRAELKGRRVLLAEDVEVNAQIIVMMLSMKEMDVDHAENGREAVEMFESHPEDYYDAVLMDMRMPEMDGLTATRTIRAMDRTDAKEIPIIALTANAFDDDVQRSLQAGLNAHLSKPVEPEDLFKTLQSMIRD